MKLKKLFFLTSFFVITLCLLVYKQGYLDFNKIFPNDASRIYVNCNAQMKYNTCSIMTAAPAFSAEVTQMYLPKIGPIKADIYRKLLTSGMKMCEVIRDQCSENLKSEVCEIGQMLYSQK